MTMKRIGDTEITVPYNNVMIKDGQVMPILCQDVDTEDGHALRRQLMYADTYGYLRRIILTDMFHFMYAQQRFIARKAEADSLKSLCDCWRVVRWHRWATRRGLRISSVKDEYGRTCFRSTDADRYCREHHDE